MPAPLPFAQIACVVMFPAVSLTSRLLPAERTSPALGWLLPKPKVSVCVPCVFCTMSPRRLGLAFSTSVQPVPTTNARTNQSKAGRSA